MPSALKELRPCTFRDCADLTIYVEDDCKADLGTFNSFNIGPLPETLAGNVKVWDLRKQKNIIIPGGTEKIGSYWFCGSAAESITVPVSVKEICANAFRNCRNLRTVTLEEGSKLETIGKCAFYMCENLATINFPEALQSIRAEAFYSCTNLRRIELPGSLENIGIRCFARSRLEEVIFPESMKEVSAQAFCDCEQLKSAELNEGLEELGNSAFYMSAIESIKLPSTLKRIE